MPSQYDAIEFAILSLPVGDPDLWFRWYVFCSSSGPLVIVSVEWSIWQTRFNVCKTKAKRPSHIINWKTETETVTDWLTEVRMVNVPYCNGGRVRCKVSGTYPEELALWCSSEVPFENYSLTCTILTITFMSCAVSIASHCISTKIF